MTIIEWRSEFAVGIEIVDHDHRELVGRIKGRQLELAVCEDPDRIIEILDKIYTDIAEHFALEERIMEQMNYPALAEHQEDHQTLLEDLREIMVEVEDFGALDEIQLTDDLDRWFSDHFRVHDAKLHRAESDQG
ncbi:MAG: hemerythrin family protein [Woeseiaceae bacterium]|nr:hemerythrin family protein [Woeseiaceae bacterium]